MTSDKNLSRQSSVPTFSLRFLLLFVAIFAVCLAFVVSSENKYHAICWLVPPLLILTRNHRNIGWVSLGVQFVFAVVVWSILFFPAVFQDTEKWLAENEDWVNETAGYDAINENLVAFFGFIPATIYSSFVLIFSCGITYFVRRWKPKSDAPIA